MNSPPTAFPDFASTQASTSVSVDVLANDTDPDAGDDPTTFSLDSVAIRPAVGNTLVPIDIDNSQMQGGRRRVYPQLPTAEEIFPLDGSSIDYTFQFTEAEFLESSQDFRFSLVIFLESSTSISNQTFGFDTEWDFLDENGQSVYSYSGGKVSIRTTAGIPQLRLSGSDVNEVSDFAPSGMPFYGIRVAATMPDLISQAPDVRVQSPNPALQDGAEFSLNGSSSGAWSIGQGIAGPPWGSTSNQGSVSIIDDQLVFDPGSDFVGLSSGESRTVQVDYTMSDDEGLSATSTASITVNGVSSNQPPVANSDSVTTDELSLVSVDVLANDTDPDPGDDPSNFSLDAASILSGDGGMVSIVSNQLQFDPAGDFAFLNQGESATVVVEYTMSDDEGATSSSSLTVLVTGIDSATNTPPTANPDAASTDKITPVSVNVLANDTDPDAGDGPSTFTLDSATIRSASASVVPIDVDQAFMQGGRRRVYPQLPNAEQLFPLDGSSIDHTFQFTEGEFLESSQDFRYSVVIFMTSSTSVRNETYGFDATWEFLDVNGAPLYSYTGGEVVLRTTAGIPQLRISNNDVNGISDFAPSGMPFYGIRVTATMPDLLSIAPDIRVQSPNPDLQEGAEFSLNGSSPGAWSIGQGGSTIPWSGGADLGSVSIVGNQLVFDPRPDFDDLTSGEATDVLVDYTMSDDEGATSSSTATITVNGTLSGGNQPPVANPDTATTSADSSITVNVLANDTDPDVGDDPSNFSLDAATVISGAGGTVTIVNDQLQFDPGTAFDSLNSGDVGVAVVSYTMSDDEGLTSSSTATIDVLGVGNTNTPPVANPDVATTDEGSSILIDVLANDTDPDAGDDPTTFSLDSASIRPTGGTVVEVDIDDSQMIGGSRRIYPSIPNAEQLFPVTGGSFDYLFRFTESEFLDASQDFSFGIGIPLDTTSSIGNRVFNQSLTWEFLDETNQAVYSFVGGQVATRRRSSELALLNVDATGASEIAPAGIRFSTIRVAGDLPNLQSIYPDVSVTPGETDFSLSGTSSGGTWTIGQGSGGGAGTGDGGLVTISNNQLQFDPNGDFDSLNFGESATVVIDYSMSDDEGASATSTVTVTINGTNPPAAALAIWAVDVAFVESDFAIPASDIDGDGEVDFADFLILSANYGAEVTEIDSAADLNEDGFVDFADFLMLSRDFGR